MDKQFIGQTLLKRGFRDFFLYLFRLIEERSFIVEPLHEQLFEYFQNIYDGKVNRCVINIAPRSAKTTLSQYFLIYVLTQNPKSQIIYTSYSQSLLSEISNKIANILEHPIYKALFPMSINQEQEELKPIDEFWRDYLFQTSNKNTYSNKLIRTYAGGLCLFISCGGQITGYGAGLRNSNKFGGMLICDDIQKPIDTKSEVLRKKIFNYFEETLLSRLNNPNVPIINIQQRLHVEDLSGYLIAKYNYDKLVIPLLDEYGNCKIPSQYTNERLTELQLNTFLWNSQYMQNPILPNGNIINVTWFRYFPTNIKYNYKRIFITADTAMKVKEHNDYSVFIVGGVTEDNKLHILDMRRGKWEAPDLKRVAVEIFEKWKIDKNTGLACSGLYIEDKASGVGLIQELKRVGVPVIGVEVNKDKLTRVEEILTYIDSGQVLLPNADSYGFNPDILKECSEFSRDDSHIHDDIVDSLCMSIKQGLAKTKVSLLDYFLQEK